MSKHTPGPWRVGADTYSGEQHQMVIDELGFILFDSVNRTGPPESQLADMTLAAAAPDLLEALRVFVSCAYPVSTEINERGHRWTEAYLDQALSIARAAIAKAEGRA